MSAHFYKRACKAFTLTELIVALIILATIVGFTIPKLIGAYQNAHYNAIAKETIASLSAGVQSYLLTNASSGLGSSNVATKLSYAKIDTTSLVNSWSNSSSLNCAGYPNPTCLRLHNGAILSYNAQDNTCAGTPTGTPFGLDPDGRYIAGSNDNLLIYVYSTGKVKTATFAYADQVKWTYTSAAGGACNGNSTMFSLPSQDPAWFSGW